MEETNALVLIAFGVILFFSMVIIIPSCNTKKRYENMVKAGYER